MKEIKVYAVLAAWWLAYRLVRFLMLGDFTGVYWLSLILVAAVALFILTALKLAREP